MLKFPNPPTKIFYLVSGLAISGRECWLLGRINFSWAKIHKSLPESIRRKDHWIKRLQITTFHHFPLQNLTGFENLWTETVEVDNCPSIRRVNSEDSFCQFDCFPVFFNPDCPVGIQSHRCDFKKFPKVPPAWFSLTLKKRGSEVDTCGQKWQVPRQIFPLFLGGFVNSSIFPLLWSKPYRNRITQFVSATAGSSTPPLTWGLI